MTRGAVISFGNTSKVFYQLFCLTLLTLVCLTRAEDCAWDGCPEAKFPCCSQYGHCGATYLHCDADTQGCQSNCWPRGAATNETGNCKLRGCRYNINGPCCGANGNCGDTAEYCDARLGCVSGCWTEQKDGCKLNGCQQYDSGRCCSQWGYCGDTEEYCAVDQGCLSGCWPSSTTYNKVVANCQDKGCPSSNAPCCSAWGVCGSTAAFCNKTQGCVSGCWAGGSSSGQTLISRLVHKAFLANTRSSAYWPSARATFFGVVDETYKLTSMSRVKYIWDDQKQRKANAESTGSTLWLGNPTTYIDSVISQVTDTNTKDLLRVLSLSAKRMVATKPQECGTEAELNTFCYIPQKLPTQANIECTRYNCFFNPGMPCVTRNKKMAKCSDPTFFSSNKILCPAMGCEALKRKRFDTSVDKNRLSRSFFSELLRRRLKQELRAYIRGKHDKRAVCSATGCESCGMTSDSFSDNCQADWNGWSMCCVCAFDFGPINSIF